MRALISSVFIPLLATVIAITSSFDLSSNLANTWNALIDFSEPSVQTAHLSFPPGFYDLIVLSLIIRTGHSVLSDKCYTADPSTVGSLQIRL